jgi:hypothetical protein
VPSTHDRGLGRPGTVLAIAVNVGLGLTIVAVKVLVAH